MALVHLASIEPFKQISSKVSPEPLRWVLLNIFSNTGEGIWLVGGTALAGYYAEHRRSDDLDLFAVNPEAFHATTLAVKALKNAGADFQKEVSTPNYYRAALNLRKHSFTIDVVLDENLNHVGRAFKTFDGVSVADLPTLFATKSACLLSRCSEKDLYDLKWLFDHMGGINVSEIVQQGALIDGGMNTEGMLISLQGAHLRKDACHFLLENSPHSITKTYDTIVKLQKNLIRSILQYEKTAPLPKDVTAIAEAIKDHRR